VLWLPLALLAVPDEAAATAVVAASTTAVSTTDEEGAVAVAEAVALAGVVAVTGLTSLKVATLSSSLTDTRIVMRALPRIKPKRHRARWSTTNALASSPLPSMVSL